MINEKVYQAIWWTSRQDRHLRPRLHLQRPSGGGRGRARDAEDLRGARHASSHVQRAGARLPGRLAQRFADHPLVGEVRGVGLIGAVELVEDKKTKEAFDPARQVGAYRRRPRPGARPHRPRRRRHHRLLPAADHHRGGDRRDARALRQGAGRDHGLGRGPEAQGGGVKRYSFVQLFGTRSGSATAGSRPGAARSRSRTTTSSSSAAAATASPPPTTSPRTTASRNVAVLEKGWIGGGNTGRNTTIVRSNYFCAEAPHLYEQSLKLYEGLSAASSTTTSCSASAA